MDPELYPALERVRALLELQRPAEAERHARAVLAHHPDEPEAHGLLAIALARLGRHRQAEDAARQAVALAPDDAVTYWRLACVMAAAGQVRPALAPVDTALQLWPWFVEAHVTHSELLLTLNDAAGALAAAEKALGEIPDLPSALSAYSRAARALGRTDDARRAAEAALAGAPTEPDAHRALGWAALQAGDREEAILAFREALRLDPHDPHARASLLEALRARSGPYAWMLRMTLRLDARRGPRSRLDFVGLGFGVIMLTLGAMRQWPVLTPVAIMLSVCLLMSMLASWGAKRLSDALLLFDRENRHIFTAEERRATISSVVGVAWLVPTVVVALTLGAGALLLMLALGMVLLALYPAMVARRRWLRRGVIGWAYGMAVVGAYGMIAGYSREDPLGGGPMALALAVLLLAVFVPFLAVGIESASIRLQEWRWQRVRR